MTINRLAHYSEKLDQLYASDNYSFKTKTLSEIKNYRTLLAETTNQSSRFTTEAWNKTWGISPELSTQFTQSVKNLSSNEFSIREESQHLLTDQRALPWLKEALGSSEQETRIRARNIIRKFVTNNRIVSDFGSTLDDPEVLQLIDLPKLIPISRTLENGNIKKQIASLKLLQECVKHPGSDFYGDYAERVLKSLNSESKLLGRLDEKRRLNSLTIKLSAPAQGEESPLICLNSLGSISQVERLNLSDLSANDTTIDHLPELKNLKDLNLSCSTLTPGGYKSLFSRLPGLEKLDVRDSIITKQTLEVIGCHDKLKSLSIGWGTRTHIVTPRSPLPSGLNSKDFGPLSNLRELEHLHIDLDCTDAITDNGMTFLSKMDRLKSLYISKAILHSGESLKLMKSRPNLEDLSLVDCKVTNQGLANLSNAKHLRRLKVRGGEFNEVGMKAIGTLSGLHELDLRAIRIAPQSLHHINQLQELTKLTLKWSDMSDDDVASIAKMKSIVTLNLSESYALTDKSIDYLKQMKNLESLDLSFSKISSERLEALRSAIPNCEISQTR
ncbi:MAG: hypothetical protein K2X93_04865 [Candidatus Obscuribacterales bacterium]|nr:hypothetical protein [Candidatus Obscuribacterales bacterium]